MYWVAFAILLYVVAVLQTAVVPFFAVHGVRPDLMVIVAVHYALSARAADALLTCWTIGLVTDLCGLGYAHHAAVGAHALALGLVGLFIVGLRDFTFRDGVTAQLFFTFTAGLLQSLLVGLHLRYAATSPPAPAEVLLGALYGAVYTALLAPYAHWLLRRLRAPLGIGPPHRVRVG
jgi:rod shape-determining protein MreD